MCTLVATGKQRYIAIAVMIMASLFSACVYVILRKIGSAKKVHFMQTVTYFGMVGTAVALIPIAITGVTVPTPEEFMGLTLMGLCAFVAQMMFCKVRYRIVQFLPLLASFCPYELCF